MSTSSIPTPPSSNPAIVKRGLHNWRNLFRKPKGHEWIILIMLILGGMMAYSYNNETKLCRETLANLEPIACQVCTQHLRINEINNQQNSRLLNESQYAADLVRMSQNTSFAP